MTSRESPLNAAASAMKAAATRLRNRLSPKEKRRKGTSKDESREQRLTARVKRFAKYFGGIASHEGMLADAPRVDTYARALKHFITPGSTVVDLGTGSGILAMLAAKAGAKTVYAIECTDVIDVARTVARHNGVSNIQFFKEYSNKVTLPTPVDFIVHEQMANVLDKENMIANVLDLRDRFLKKGGRILPNVFQFYVEPVQLRAQSQTPFLWEQNIHGIDFSCTRPDAQAFDKHYYRTIKHYDVEFLLSDPEPLFEFDLETLHPGDLPSRFSYQRRIVRDGRLDGLVFFFVASFGDGISINTNPTVPYHPYSWFNEIYRLEARNVAKGDVIAFDFTMNDIRDHHTWEWREVPGT